MPCACVFFGFFNRRHAWNDGAHAGQRENRSQHVAG
jgi:hypothetical protein